jgi:hypothetical protein
MNALTHLLRGRAAVWAAALPLSFALGCGGEKASATDSAGSAGDEGAGEAGGDGGGDDGASAGCPEEVPEAYRFIWDCGLSSCPGGPLFYNYGEGASTAGGDISVSERWFGFYPDDYCVDTFLIEGTATDVDPADLACSQCEEVYAVSWTMSSGNQCSLAWGSLFIDDNDEIEGPFDGYILFDTHTAFGDRNEDDAMLVIGAPGKGRTVYPNPNWGRGTAIPESADQAPGGPEAYLWTNGGLCANGGALKDAGGAIQLPGTGPLLDPEGRYSLTADKLRP